MPTAEMSPRQEVLQEDPIRQVLSQAPKQVGVELVLQVRLLSKVQCTSRT